MTPPVPPLVGIVMGSQSDWPTLREAARVLDELGVPHEARLVSAHRTPDRLWAYGREAAGRGLKVIVAGAGGAAHLPGMMASKTLLPVIGVPVETKALGGLDSLYSIVQMPRGVPVATMAIGGALKGSRLGEFWKYRVGDYRIVARIEDERLTILVVRVGNRREVYR